MDYRASKIIVNETGGSGEGHSGEDLSEANHKLYLMSVMGSSESMCVKPDTCGVSDSTVHVIYYLLTNFSQPLFQARCFNFIYNTFCFFFWGSINLISLLLSIVIVPD